MQEEFEAFDPIMSEGAEGEEKTGEDEDEDEDEKEEEAEEEAPI
jgi:hypothetical protein